MTEFGFARETGMGRSAEEMTEAERRDRQQNNRRILGHVVQCDGVRAVIRAVADASDGLAGAHWTVGRLISINLGASRIVGLVYEVDQPQRTWVEGEDNAIEVKVELIGEVRDASGARPLFDRGISNYPYIGAVAHRIRARDLQCIYDLAGRRGVTLGSLSQDDAIEAIVSVDDMLARHFAVVGTTGVGKSTAVSLILRQTIEARPDLRVLILDPHNEFAAALPDHSVRIDTATLDLPFWMFRLDEFCEVIFRGREVVPEEVDVLRDLIPVAKQMYRSSNGGTFRRATDAPTADAPLPYRIADLLKLIDERMGALEGKSDRPFLRALKARLDSAVLDPGYRFMFASRLIEDTLHQTVGTLFRLPHEGRPVTCFEMAGMPSEVVNAVCSVLARLAFDLAVGGEGRLRLLVLCEEAHRYMPADPRLGFAPTRHALSRIAKEGRKYGCFLGVVTQRPGELDPTVLSQCSTVFAMRLANEQDQAIIRSAIADSSASTLNFLSSMGQREAIAFGDGVAATMRLKFAFVPPEAIPGSAERRAGYAVTESAGSVDLAAIVERLRHGLRSAAAPGGETASPAFQAGDPGFRQQRETIAAALQAALPRAPEPAAPAPSPLQRPPLVSGYEPEPYGVNRINAGLFGQRSRT